MATKTLGTGGDYATFAAAVAGIATWDVLNVITAGTYTEAAALSFAKAVQIVNLSGGQVTVQTPLGSHIGQISGGVTVTWAGDFVHEIRKPGSGGTEYHWLISGSGSKLILNGITLKSDYTTGNTQAIYQAAGNSHEMNDCTLQGTYEALVTLADNCASSVIDGLIIDGLTEYIIRGNTSSAMFDVFNWRDIAGQVTRAPAHNAASGNRIDVTTSGLLTTSRMYGMTATGNMVLGSGAIVIEKSVFSGTKAYAIEAVSGVSTGLTFRSVAFAGFSSYGVRVSGAALSGLIDYCGRSNGCAAFSNSAGSEGAHNVTADPLFTDYAGHDYTIPSNSSYRDAGTTCVATADPIGTVIPQGTSPDIGAYEYQQRPSVISGAGQGLTVDVRLDLPIDPVTVGAPGDWAVEPLFAGGHVAVTAVAYTPGSLQIVLNLSEALTSVEAYRVTAPATVATDTGALIDNRTADFVAPRYIEAESSGILNCTLDGEIIETGEPKFELIPWGADVPGTDLMQLTYISLFTDARLDKSEVMSSDTRDLGGWWADAFTGVAPIGSRLHRLFRVLPTATNIQQAQIHCLMALDWMVQDRLIAKAEVEIKRTGLGAASGKVTLYERDGNKIVKEWADFWKMLR